jgi:hypothetical protein
VKTASLVAIKSGDSCKGRAREMTGNRKHTQALTGTPRHRNASNCLMCRNHPVAKALAFRHGGNGTRRPRSVTIPREALEATLNQSASAPSSYRRDDAGHAIGRFCTSVKTKHSVYLR